MGVGRGHLRVDVNCRAACWRPGFVLERVLHIDHVQRPWGSVCFRGRDVLESLERPQPRGEGEKK